jgi:CheY-like chemotaxis protein
MPEMDGIEATRKIREFSKDIPIIAVTAGILNEKKQQCLDSGMNDFLYKPIELDRLRRILKKYLFPRSVTTRKNVVVDDSLHFDKISLLQKITFDEKFLQEVIEIARITIPETIKLLANAIDIQDKEEIQKNAHKIKGSAANICFNQLAKLAKTIEKESYAGNQMQLNDLFEKIEKEWEEIIAILD